MKLTYGQKNLFDLVNDFDAAMLVTYSADSIHARPMVIAQLDFGIGVYLIANINSFKIDEICVNQNALLTFQSARRFASVSGELAVLVDRELIEKLWKEAWKAWFHGGKRDPNIALLKFTTHEGEFWDNAGLQGLKYVYEVATACITGETLVSDPAQHDKVPF
jgi:general stress protein 26